MQIMSASDQAFSIAKPLSHLLKTTHMTVFQLMRKSMLKMFAVLTAKPNMFHSASIKRIYNPHSIHS